MRTSRSVRNLLTSKTTDERLRSIGSSVPSSYSLQRACWQQSWDGLEPFRNLNPQQGAQMNIFRQTEEVPPVRLEGNDVVIPQSSDQPQPQEEQRKKLPKTKWW